MVGRASSCRVAINGCPLLSAVVLHLFSTFFRFVATEYATALETDENRSASNSLDIIIIIVGSLVTKSYALQTYFLIGARAIFRMLQIGIHEVALGQKYDVCPDQSH